MLKLSAFNKNSIILQVSLLVLFLLSFTIFSNIVYFFIIISWLIFLLTPLINKLIFYVIHNKNTITVNSLLLTLLQWFIFSLCSLPLIIWLLYLNKHIFLLFWLDFSIFNVSSIAFLEVFLFVFWLYWIVNIYNMIMKNDKRVDKEQYINIALTFYMELLLFLLAYVCFLA